MKKLFIISLIAANFGFAQWEMRNNGLPDNWGNSLAIDAEDDFNAIISILFSSAGYLPSTLFRTTDGGQNWFQLPAPAEAVIDVELWGNKIWGATEMGKIIYSSDGGQSWVVQYSDSAATDFMNYIEMFDELNGIAMGDVSAGSPTYNPGPALFLKTTDGGLTWGSVNDSAFGGISGDYWRRIDFVSPEIGYFRETGVNPGRVYKTKNGCTSWAQLPLSGNSVLIKFYDENIGISSNVYDYSLSLTVNGGSGWRTFSSPLKWGSDFEFEPGNPAFVWGCDSENLYFSSDTGKVWQAVTTPLSDLHGRDMVFTGETTLWVLCDGAVLRNPDVHNITSVKSQVLTPGEFYLEQNYPNPFNPSTEIGFNLDRPGLTTLKIYTGLGELVGEIINGVMEAGYHQVHFDGSKLNSGVYFYQLTSGSHTITKKMLLLK